VTRTTPLDVTSATVEAFLARTTEDAGFAAEVGTRTGSPAESTATLLCDLASEVRRAATLLHGLPCHEGARVLEIGSGPGLVAALLHQQGVDVTGLDPIVEGFEASMAVQKVLADRMSMPTIMPIAAADLNPVKHGMFDLIFSVNVLEHIRPLVPNLDGLARVLAPGGLMIHTCPNYRMPYEPHYRLVLAPGRPAWTRYILRSTGREPVWQSLNWITAGSVRRFARRHNLTLTFLRGETIAALDRLRDDPHFARRHRGLIATTLRALDAVGLSHLLGRLPATWTTPMTFILKGPDV